MAAGSALNSAFYPICTPAPPALITATAPTPERSGLVAHPLIRFSTARCSLRMISRDGWAEVRFLPTWRAGYIAPPTVGKLGAHAPWMILGRSVRFAL